MKDLNSKKSGNEVYYTVLKILLVKIMLCRKLYYQNVLTCKSFHVKCHRGVQEAGWRPDCGPIAETHRVGELRRGMFPQGPQLGDRLPPPYSGATEGHYSWCGPCRWNESTLKSLNRAAHAVCRRRRGAPRRTRSANREHDPAASRNCQIAVTHQVEAFEKRHVYG